MYTRHNNCPPRHVHTSCTHDMYTRHDKCPTRHVRTTCTHDMYTRHNKCPPRHAPTEACTHDMCPLSVLVNDIPDEEDPREHSDNNDKGDKVKLTSLIRTREHPGMTPLTSARRNHVAPCVMLHHDIWDAVLCEGVPVSLRELISLTLVQLQLADTQTNRHKMLQCTWTLGWHVTATSSGVTSHYWGGGVTPNTTDRFRRGDWVEIAGTELCRSALSSRLARVICGVKIDNIKRVFENVNGENVWQNEDCEKQDYVVLILVRYAKPHPECGRARGPECRPLCPGELRSTHCLWKWHQRPATFRRGCWRPRPWERHKRLFGDTPEEQQTRHEQEMFAWYDVLSSNNIVGHANVTSDWDRDESFLQSVMWA